jgi:hypothetical protein
MIRTQVQLPERLYRDVQRVAREHDWSIAEVIRRGAEVITRAYPHFKNKAGQGWQFPPPIRGKLLITDPKALRDLR